MNKQTKRMNKIFYALLAQAVFVAASAPARAQTDPATASPKRALPDRRNVIQPSFPMP